MRFVIEHLHKASATYDATPVEISEARLWLADGSVTSLVRTTELISAIQAGCGVSLNEADHRVDLNFGDEALQLCLSFGVLLAWAQGGIVPVENDWRCHILRVSRQSDTDGRPLALADDLPARIES